VIAGAPPPQPATCASLLLPAPPIEHAFKLPGGRRAVLRDPYGGVVSRNRLFVQFTVKSARRDQLVDHVEWRLDGAAIAGNRGGRYSLLLQSTKLQAGAHSLTAHVAARDGSTVDKSIDLNVTDCQKATFGAELRDRRGAELSVGSGGPALRSLGFTAVRGVRTRLPRGRVVGSLAFVDGTLPFRAQAPKPLTLRAPRRGGVLLRQGSLKVTARPAKRDFLIVTGLPAKTTGVRIRLRGVVRMSRTCPTHATVRATLVPSGGGGAALDSSERC
jgi:hypothetical protein